MPIYAIGDVQGCYDEFQRLLERLDFDPSRDKLWLVGDLVNRGPRSLDVLRAVKKMGSSAVTVLGNHDLHLLAAALSPAKQLKPKDTLGAIFTAPDRDELLHWLRHRPLLHHDSRLGWTMIHAGLAPEWDLPLAQRCAEELQQALQDDDTYPELFARMYGDQPGRWRDDLHGFDRLRFITNCLTRLRFCRADGTLELRLKGGVDNAPPHVMPWFRVPHRRSRDHRIVFGHWSALGYYAADNVVGIDAGCVWGNQLCAVRLDEPAAPVFTPCSSSGLSIEAE
jgi:bis(5'-nucleosyl)-tetraphosphatase (symmetrical)